MDHASGALELIQGEEQQEPIEEIDDKVTKPPHRGRKKTLTRGSTSYKSSSKQYPCHQCFNTTSTLTTTCDTRSQAMTSASS